MESLRKPFQGVLNIIRFNWHYYVLSFAVIAVIFFLRNNLNATPRAAVNYLLVIAVCTILLSLLVSSYIYDFSDLYKFSWLSNLKPTDGKIMNIHAGFDETSSLLKSKFRNSTFIVADFYDPAKHTEISIKRARKAYPAFPGTQQVSTQHLPAEDNSIDKVFLILSAHEIRSDEERLRFFKELHRTLTPSGQIIVTEHLRDLANFIAYNIGFFHFHAKATWLKTFHLAGLTVAKELKITPFITIFVLEKNGTAS